MEPLPSHSSQTVATQAIVARSVYMTPEPLRLGQAPKQERRRDVIAYVRTVARSTAFDWGTKACRGLMDGQVWVGRM